MARGDGFATFWAKALVVMGMLLVTGGVLLAAVAVTLDMPWGRVTGKAVLEQALAAIVLVASGFLAGAPFIALGEMLRIFVRQRRTIERQRRLLTRLARRADEASGQRSSASPAADRLLQRRS